MKFTKLVSIAVIASITLLAIPAASAPTLTFRFKRIDVPGAFATHTYSVNNDGVVVGMYVDNNGRSHGYMKKSGEITTIDPPPEVSERRPMMSTQRSRLSGTTRIRVSRSTDFFTKTGHLQTSPVRKARCPHRHSESMIKGTLSANM